MIKIPITRNLAHNAALKAEEIPADIHNSIKSGKNRFIGCLGEAGLIKFLKEKGESRITWASTGHYDIMFGENNTKLEVKSKKVESIPEPHHEASVSCYNTKQQCDYYVFIRITNTDIYLIGYITPEELYEKGVKKKKGEKDTNIVNGKQFTYKSDCINIRHDQLNKFRPRHS